MLSRDCPKPGRWPLLPIRGYRGLPVALVLTRPSRVGRRVSPETRRPHPVPVPLHTVVVGIGSVGDSSAFSRFNGRPGPPAGALWRSPRSKFTPA